MTPLRVLVTRPEPGASRSARAIEALGHHPILLPLSRLEGLSAQVAGGLHDVDAVAVTSAGALRFADEALLDVLRGKLLFAVGAQTAEAARKKGFVRVEQGPGDAEGLAAVIAANPSFQRVAYLCGRVRRPDFEAALSQSGVSVTPVETYGTVALNPSPEQTESALSRSGVDAVMLYSVLAADSFVRLRQRASKLFDQAAVFALSPRIARVAGPGCFSASAPNEDALLALFEDWAGVKHAERRASFPPGETC